MDFFSRYGIISLPNQSRMLRLKNNRDSFSPKDLCLEKGRMLKMVFKNYYKILELETSHVSIDEIKIAYRKVAKKYHPDLNVGDKLAEEKIKDFQETQKKKDIQSLRKQ